MYDLVRKTPYVIAIITILFCTLYLTGCEGYMQKAEDILFQFEDSSDRDLVSKDNTSLDSENLPIIIMDPQKIQDYSQRCQELAFQIENNSLFPHKITSTFLEYIAQEFGKEALDILSNSVDAKMLLHDTFYEATGNTYFALHAIYEEGIVNSDTAIQNKSYFKEVKNSGEITLTFAGDVCLDDSYSNMAALRGRKNGIFDCFSPDLMSEMNNADIMMLNNEFTFSTRGTPTLNKQYTFRTDPQRVELLQQMGVDIVALANNHTYDYGEDALLDTLDTLDNADIIRTGAGRNISEAMEPSYIIAGGMKIGFISATQVERTPNPDTKEATESSPGVLRTLNPDKTVEAIQNAEANCDFVVVYVHWGSENTAVVDSSQKDLAGKYAEAGADLIMGDHSHCLQGFEYIGNVPIVYSLSNFWFNTKTVDTCLIKVKINKDGIQSYQMLPAIQRNSSTSLVSGTEKTRILNYMQNISFNASIDAEGFISIK